MPKITSIKYQKNGKRVNLYVDEEYLISFNAELVYKYNLNKGEDIDTDKITQLIKQDDYDKAKMKALNYISRTQKSEKKIREKLLKEYDIEIVDKVIDFMKKYSFVDDSTFAHQLVNNGMNYKKVGKKKIQQDLYLKGIGKEDRESAMESIDDDIELENAIYLAEKRKNRIKTEDKNILKNKLFQHLAYKGFDYSTINKAIRCVLENSY
ncbi:regulatory protein RecX [Peptostreptococcus faecalis]|uniref:regulatory protein RecX n=1 Tax=Peptostreptococcus faecalis TaxID=2045015 RepID=UPI000C7BE640|nr:RecX family transcriptional regulator [Peptostreptococcus faecalis]